MDKVRLDKWLWVARFYKTRGLAGDAVDAGKIEVNGERAKRARMIHPGDRLRIRQGPYEHVITVTALAMQRGSASVAQGLYQEDEESVKARQRVADHVRAMRAATGYESGRPTKRDRRDIEKLRGRG